MIKPIILKGFRDSLPKDEIQREISIEKIKKAFRSFGFVPIDTPILEYEEILLKKGGGETDKQIFSFTDNGDRRVAMRFDLTVPFARFVAQYEHDLTFPFKRYHIAKVFRGEKPQKGRYREFYQCDFDIIGSTSLYSDFEIISLMIYTIKELGLSKFKIHINSRDILHNYITKLGLSDKETFIFHQIDKLKKIGKEKMKKELLDQISEKDCDKIINFISIDKKESFLSSLKRLEDLSDSKEEGARLREIYHLLKEIGYNDFILLDSSITRGLDYYTSIVFETFLDEYPEIGSICSGGRYNDLASLYTKSKISGIGASIGLDRLLSIKESNDEIFTKIALIVDKVEGSRDLSYKLAFALREKGIRVDVYADDKKVDKQQKYVRSLNIPYQIIINEEAVKTKKFNLKNNNDNSFKNSLSISDLIDFLTGE